MGNSILMNIVREHNCSFVIRSFEYRIVLIDFRVKQVPDDVRSTNRECCSYDQSNRSRGRGRVYVFGAQSVWRSNLLRFHSTRRYFFFTERTNSIASDELLTYRNPTGHTIQIPQGTYGSQRVQQTQNTMYTNNYSNIDEVISLLLYLILYMYTL